MWMWDKTDSVFSMFHALYKFLVAKNATAGLLFTLCSIYGPWEIPGSFLRRLELCDIVDSTDSTDFTDSTNHWRQLQALVRDEVAFNMATYELYRIFLAKRKHDDDGSLRSISLHSYICQWRFATIGDQTAEWVIQASYGLARHLQSIYDRQQ